VRPTAKPEEQEMAQPDSKLTPAATGTEMAMSGVEAASKNMQVLTSELAEISQQSFEHAIQTFEKLRKARNTDEVFAIQTRPYISQNAAPFSIITQAGQR
jgi:hypothetical protein